jgi:hypothetical protein
MPWVREIKAKDVDLTEVGNLLAVGRFWGDGSFIYDSFHPVDTATRDKTGLLTISTHYYTENSRVPKELTVYVDAEDILAYILPEGPSHEARLYLGGGYLVARARENLRGWDAYQTDGTLIREDVTTEEGRALIA